MGVEFFVDTSGTGEYIPGQAQSLGAATLGSNGWWTLTNINTSGLGLSGPQTFFAVATDDLDQSGDAAVLAMDSSAPPTLVGLTVSSDLYVPGDVLSTLAATGCRRRRRHADRVVLPRHQRYR